MRVFLVDDEPLARERLRRMLATAEEYQVVGEAGNGEAALAGIVQAEPDIVLLDIRMPGMDGIAVAKQLANSEQAPAVVFCTAYNEHAAEAFQVHAIGYLLKPVRQDALLDALRGAQRINRAQLVSLEANRGPRRRQISVRSHRGLQLIELEDIYYFMADQKYVRVRHRGGDVLIDEPLKELENEFGDAFVRVHRNALVAVAWVEALQRGRDGQYSASFRDIDDRVPVSRRCIAMVKQRLQER